MTLNLFAALTLVTLALGLFLPTPTHAEPQRVCRPARIEAAIVWRGDGPFVQGIPYQGEAIWQVLQGLHGPSFWRKVGDYGTFDIPEGWQIVGKIYLLPGRQWYWFATHPSQPDIVYVFAFPNDAIYSLPDGSKEGPHPTCGTFTISQWTYAHLWVVIASSPWGMAR